MSVADFYHLIESGAWESFVKENGADAAYSPASLSKEGFVHCSTRELLEETANLYFTTCSRVTALQLRHNALKHEVKFEEGRPGKMFPHIFGPINRDAIVAEVPLVRSAEGKWTFP